MPAPAASTASAWAGWLVCLDIDGTILHHDGRLAQKVRDAIERIDRAGAVVVLATGRSTVATLPVLEQLGLLQDGREAVCSNGATSIVIDSAVEAGYRFTDVVTFDPAPVIALLRAEMPQALVAVEEVGVGFKLTAPFPDGELSGEQRIVDEAELAATPATRVTFRDPAATPEDFMEMLDRIGMSGANYAVGYTAWLDVHPEGVSKAFGLERVRQARGIDPARTLAVGDQRNDLEMFAWAGHAVAMGQAPGEVQAAADRVTLPVEQDGLAYALIAPPPVRDAEPST